METASIPIADFTSSEFVTVKPFPHPTQQSVMPVVAYKGNTIRPLGTCFAISNHGLVITARHVIDEAFQITGWSPDSPPLTTNGWEVGALYISESPPGCNVPDLFGGILPANRIHVSPFLDIGVMHLRLRVNVANDEAIRMPAMRISPGLPENDTDCLTLGYHGMKCNSSLDGSHSHEISQSYSAAKGKITNLHYPYRDLSSLNFPCFETTSRFDAGMSGGPILNTHGSVIGVVCSSFGNVAGNYISYGSLIGPAMLLQIDVSAEGNTNKAFLYDFIVGGAVGSDKSDERLRIKREGDSLEIDFGHPVIVQGLLGKYQEVEPIAIAMQR